MANNYTTLSDLFTDIANAIRIKQESTASIKAYNFPTEIENIKSGFDYVNYKVATLPDYAFYGCEDLNNVVECINITSIGMSAFENCSKLKTIMLYDGVESIGENAFKGCPDLTIFCEVDSKPANWHENWNPDDCAVVWGNAPVETWDISDTENDNVVAKLYNDTTHEGMYLLDIRGNGAMNFSNKPWGNYIKQISLVKIRDGVTNICGNAFNYITNIISITIPDSVTSIGEMAFYGCESLTSVAIGGGVTSIGRNAFMQCSKLTNVTISEGVTRIGENMFRGCSRLTSIIYTGTVTQWNAIPKGSYWNNSTGNYIIHCLDGDIAKDGTITYHGAEM